MLPSAQQTNEAERDALLGLWAVSGVGPKTIQQIRGSVSAQAVLDEPVAQWSASLSLAGPARAGLEKHKTLRPLAEAMLEQAERGRMGIATVGHESYPERLAEIGDAPPVLFFRGPACRPRRRIAMVGSRQSGSAFDEFCRQLANQLSARGAGIVSGAADGVDKACHLGAVDAGGESWAFVGCALDKLDARAALLEERVLASGGTYYSELPPGIHASQTTFPRRNRLISGASDAVLVLRAGATSGALHTARYAALQGRPILAVPGEPRNELAAGCNELIRRGAKLCTTADQVLEVLGLSGTPALLSDASKPVPLGEASQAARAAFECLNREPRAFEELLEATRLESGTLTSALCELELMGVVVQRPGKRYEKV